MLRQPFTFALAAAAGGLAFAGTAQADSLFSFIVADGETVNDVSDDNAEFLIDENQNGNLDVGDAIRGVVNFNAINSGSANLGGATPNEEFTGLFQIEVTGKIDEGNGNFTFTFGPDDDFDMADQVLGGNGNASNAMVLLWSDASNNFDYDSGIATAEATATDGDFVWAIGFEDPDAAAHLNNAGDDVESANGEGWVGQGGEAFTSAAGVNPTSLIGSANFAASLVGNGPRGNQLFIEQNIGAFLANLFGADADDMVEFIGNSTINGAEGSLAAGDFDASSQTEFSFVVVPTPAALGPGIALLGMLVARRRRRQVA